MRRCRTAVSMYCVLSWPGSPQVGLGGYGGNDLSSDWVEETENGT